MTYGETVQINKNLSYLFSSMGDDQFNATTDKFFIDAIVEDNNIIITSLELADEYHNKTQVDIRDLEKVLRSFKLKIKQFVTD